MPKPDDCGCGKGPKECISKKRRADTLLGLYMEECGGKPKLKGVALKKDMMKFAEKTLKKMDCGCGCEGEKTLSRLSGGAGQVRKNCPVELNMSGTGFSEDTAYIGIDMSPLEGAGAPRSFEQMYVQSQADIHRQKVDMVHRRAAQRTVKIKPYTQRPELLSDTFKEGPYGRDIHGQLSGGNALSDWRNDLMNRAKAFLWARGDYRGDKCGGLFGKFDCCDPGDGEGEPGRGTAGNPLWREVKNVVSARYYVKESPIPVSDAELINLVDDVITRQGCPFKAGVVKGEGPEQRAAREAEAKEAERRAVYNAASEKDRLKDVADRKRNLEADKIVAAQRASPLRAAFFDKYDMSAEEVEAAVNASEFPDYRILGELSNKVEGQAGNIDMVYEEMKAALGEPVGVKGKGKKKHKMGPLPTEMRARPVAAARAAERFRKAAKKAMKKAMRGGALTGGDWFSPSTWTWESVNPVNWTTDDWTDLAKGADAAIFGPLADPYVMKAAQAALIQGGSFAVPGFGTVGGATLAAILQGAVMAHEFVYPACEGGKKEGVLGCNEYRDDLKDVIDMAVGIAKVADQANEGLDRVSDYLASDIGMENLLEPGDVMGSGAYRGAFTRGEPQVGETEEKFYYPVVSTTRPPVTALLAGAPGGEYAGPIRTEATPASLLAFAPKF